MAASSITANLKIKDPTAVRAFVDAFLSTESWSQLKSMARADHLLSDDDVCRSCRAVGMDFILGMAEHKKESEKGGVERDGHFRSGGVRTLESTGIGSGIIMMEGVN